MSENFDIANLVANAGQGGALVMLIYFLFKKIDELKAAFARYTEKLAEYFEFVKGQAEYERGRRDAKQRRSPI